MDTELTEEDALSVASACKYLGVSRSGYYKYQKRKDRPEGKKGRPSGQQVDEEMAKVIRWVKDCWAPVQVGYRRITAIINRSKNDKSRTFLNETSSFIPWA